MTLSAAHAGFIANPSFEGSFPDVWPHYGPVAEWTGGNGVNKADGPFHNLGTPVPDQRQVAFMQGSGTLSQIIRGLSPGHSYWLQFFYDARDCCGGTVDLSVQLKDREVDRIADIRPVMGGAPYRARTVAFVASGTSETLVFETMARGDASVLLDAVTIVPRDAGEVPILNPSFEASGDIPDVGTTTGSIAGWTWTSVGTVGVVSQSSGFADNGQNPDQDHVAFLHGPSSIKQVVSGLLPGEAYTLSFACNASLESLAGLMVMVDGVPLLVRDVAAVGGTAAYRTESVSLTAARPSIELEFLQTREGSHTLLLDDIRLTGESSQPIEVLPPLAELAPGQRAAFTVSLPPGFLAVKAATVAVRSLDSETARVVNADAAGWLTMDFPMGGTNVQAFDVEAVWRGATEIEIQVSPGLDAPAPLRVFGVTSFVRNPSFESSPAPAGVGYGEIASWVGGSGVNRAHMPFLDNGAIPDRDQVGFIQWGQILRQEIFGLAPGRLYWLQFYYNARRPLIDVPGLPGLAVRLAGQELFRVAQVEPVDGQNPFHFAHVPFRATSSSGWLEFENLTDRDTTILLDGIGITPRDEADLPIRNPSFEGSGVVLDWPGYLHAKPAAGWEIGGDWWGINLDGEGPFTDNGTAADQDAVLFLQGGGVFVEQRLAGLQPGQPHRLTYSVNARSWGGPEQTQYRVSFAGVTLVEEEIAPVGGTNPYWLREVPFVPTATEGALRFENVTSTGDHSLLLDNVRISAPERDTDRDGMPDTFELAHGFAPADPRDAAQDADRDGLTNLQEFLAGTGPTDAASRLAIRDLVREEEDVVFSFASVAHKLYRVEYSDNLAWGVWDQLGSLVPGTGERIAILDPTAGSRNERYYRLSLVQPALVNLHAATPDTDLLRRADAGLGVKDGILILPASAFEAALAESDYLAVDPSLRLEAAAVAAAANDPGALGVLGDLLLATEPQAFHGNLFIVARDAALNAGGRLIQSADYFVAAVELHGQSPWLGLARSFAVDSGMSMAGNACCGPEILCQHEPLSPRPPPGPGPCDGPPKYCGRLVGTTRSPPPKLERRVTGNGLPPVNLFIYPDKHPRAGGPGLGSTGPALMGSPPGLPQIFTACSLVRSPTCERVNPTCERGEPGFSVNEDGTASIDAGSTDCHGTAGGRTFTFRQVPKICTQVMGWENLPAGCGGFCESCGEPLNLSDNWLPPACLAYELVEGSDLCRTPADIERTRKTGEAVLRSEFHCPPSGPCHECRDLPQSGAKHCIACDQTGCSEYIIRPMVDPTIADAGAVGEQQTACETLWVKEATGECAPPPSGPDYSWAGLALDLRPPSGSAPGMETVVRTNSPVPPSGPPPTQPSGGGKDDPTKKKPPTEDYNRDATPREVVSGKPKDRSERDSDGGSGAPVSVADPILLGDGSFDAEQVDLSFPGPVRPLEFRRSYNSRNGRRGTMGSNWHHNWDVRIQPLNVETAPLWTLPYGGGSPETPTGLMLYDGSGGVQVFFLDLMTGLFMPQAGSTDTIAPTATGGWALRHADGHTLYFNALGYLVNDRDRFGNGFTIDYEPTPLWELYEYYCLPFFASRSAHQRPGPNAGLPGPVTPPRLTTLGLDSPYSRRCAVLSFLLGDIHRPLPGDPWFTIDPNTDFPLPPSANPSRGRLEYARAYFIHLLGLGPNLENVYGLRKLRPVRVTDDLGRRLEFTYYRASGLNFAATPHAELLAQVRGPAGTSVAFRYARPSGYPPELNEQFLTEVNRSDAPGHGDLVPAASRRIEFRYQWPDNQVTSYNHGQWTNRLYQVYKDYFSTFVGCWLHPVYCPGELGRAKYTGGDPNALAIQQRNGFIADVADNLIQVINNGVTESETRYDVDPWSPTFTFDHATSQRYGSTLAQPAQGSLPPDDPADNWRTSLPKAVLVYRSAGPASPGDPEPTEDFLPAEIKARYPLEQPPPVDPSEPLVPVIPARGQTGGPCDFDQMKLMASRLPGQRLEVPYYDAPTNQAHPNFAGRLFRTWLTPEQLALVQAGDPTHNDLLSEFVPNTNTVRGSDGFFHRLVDGRKRVAANVNRICSWTRVIDREGRVRYYGLNYRGQTLVEAIQESATGFLFTETIYNADGFPIQQRRPTRGAQPWSPEAGCSLLTYDEIDPRGDGGWDEWLPVYWTRRANLLRVEHWAARAGVLDESEAAPGSFHTSFGRFERFTYEPLFNQVRLTERGTIEPKRTLPGGPGGGTTIGGGGVFPTPNRIDVVHSRTDFVFDYQELALADSGQTALKPVMDWLRPWGFSWWLKAGTSDYDYTNVVQSWQLPLPFHGKDLNGDGLIGFGFGQATDRAKGVPILVTVRRDSFATNHVQTYVMRWAPHGRPAAILGPDDSFTLLQYYSIGTAANGHAQAFGGSVPPDGGDISVGYRGLLARFAQQRFGASYDAANGPADSPNTALAGPYQWLLPAGTAGSPNAALRALGLPEATVAAILSSATTNSVDRWLSTSFSYSVIGDPRLVWTDTGVTRIVRDPDGRERSITDPLGNVATIAYTAQGFPERTVETDLHGALLSDTYRGFDEEGRVVYECQALEPGGCDPLGSATPKAGTVIRSVYSPEGRLVTSVDPEGSETHYEYDERGLLVQETSQPPGAATLRRQTRYEYNADGDRTAAYHGTSPNLTHPYLLSETFAYDGLRRLVTHTDTRAYSWQLAYAGRDQLTRLRRSETPYGVSSAPPSLWETEFRYDELGRMIRRIDNGILTGEYKRTPGGLIWAASSAGFGWSYTTYDRLGRPVWQRDPAGNQVVHTWQANPHVATTTRIRFHPQNGTLTTTAVQELDAMARVLIETEFGGDHQRSHRFERDGAGAVIEETSPEGYVTRIERNLLGWPVAVHQQRSGGPVPSFDTARFAYNRRGQVLRVTDPSQQVTEIDYDYFGAVKERRVPGRPLVGVSYTYDGLGRVDIELRGTERIKHRYDQRGDPAGETLEDRILGSIPLVERAFDEMGWLRESRNSNFQLSWLAEKDRTAVAAFSYDRLGRVERDRLQVGQGPPHETVSAWSIGPGSVWQRDVHYVSSLNTHWRETHDLAGRLARKERFLPGGNSLATTFDWQGEFYLGRAQAQEGRSSLFRERRFLDRFGAPLKWRYTAIDIDDRGIPLDAAEGAAYCGGPWQGDCARPLLEITAVRDVLGRIASLKWGFGHPQIGPRPPQPWRGYAYNPRGQLDHTWEHDGVAQEIPTGNLRTHLVTAAEIQAIAGNSASWHYVRETAVGGTLAISNTVNGQLRWSLPVPRGPGHQLQKVALDGRTLTITHDAQGRIQGDGTRAFIYDPRDRLAMVLQSGAILEAYAYDANGRLAATFKGNGATASLEQVFAYDGHHMAGAFDSALTPIWEAAWGPHLDQLIEWRDLAGASGDHVPLVDHRNSVVATWVPTLATVSQIGEYNAEGRLIVRTAIRQHICEEEGTGHVCGAPGGLPFGLGNAWKSPATGHLLMRNRWYSPQLGQFMSPDSLVYADGYSPFAFASLDPINRHDPFGQDDERRIQLEITKLEITIEELQERTQLIRQSLPRLQEGLMDAATRSATGPLSINPAKPHKAARKLLMDYFAPILLLDQLTDNLANVTEDAEGRRLLAEKEHQQRESWRDLKEELAKVGLQLCSTEECKEAPNAEEEVIEQYIVRESPKEDERSAYRLLRDAVLDPKATLKGLRSNEKESPDARGVDRLNPPRYGVPFNDVSVPATGAKPGDIKY